MKICLFLLLSKASCALVHNRTSSGFCARAAAVDVAFFGFFVTFDDETASYL